ncbi:hypothetical protein L6R50_15405 [Myxococcota bacterium]|nr:hypothetical protein [Myxococcota bacterium]
MASTTFTGTDASGARPEDEVGDPGLEQLEGLSPEAEAEGDGQPECELGMSVDDGLRADLAIDEHGAYEPWVQLFPAAVGGLEYSVELRVEQVGAVLASWLIGPEFVEPWETAWVSLNFEEHGGIALADPDVVSELHVKVVATDPDAGTELAYYVLDTMYLIIDEAYASIRLVDVEEAAMVARGGVVSESLRAELERAGADLDDDETSRLGHIRFARALQID